MSKTVIPAKTYGSCGGCRSNIISKKFINCCICKLRYDLLCANIDTEDFDCMDPVSKSTWKCPECVLKQPRYDNTNTPVRSEAHKAASPLPPPDIHVTKRTKAPVLSLKKEDIREIFREEFHAIKDTLIQDLQSSLKDMVRNEFRTMNKKILDLEESVKFMSDQHDSVRKIFDSQTDTVQTLLNENSCLNNTVRDLTMRLQIMEQNSRSSNIEIQCVPEHKNENLLTIINHLSKTVAFEIKPEDIHHCTRVAKANKQDGRPRAIIVKLATPRIRDTLLASIIKYNKANPDNKINTTHIGMGDKKHPIYVMEHLSPTNKRLHAAARLKAKEKGYKFVWIRQGRIFVRKTETSEFIYIKDIRTLDKLS